MQREEDLLCFLKERRGSRGRGMKLWVIALDFYTSFLDNEKERAGVIKAKKAGVLLG